MFGVGKELAITVCELRDVLWRGVTPAKNDNSMRMAWNWRGNFAVANKDSLGESVEAWEAGCCLLAHGGATVHSLLLDLPKGG